MTFDPSTLPEPPAGMPDPVAVENVHGAALRVPGQGIIEPGSGCWLPRAQVEGLAGAASPVHWRPAKATKPAKADEAKAPVIAPVAPEPAPVADKEAK